MSMALSPGCCMPQHSLCSSALQHGVQHCHGSVGPVWAGGLHPKAQHLAPTMTVGTQRDQHPNVKG